MTDSEMTKSERQLIGRLIQNREKVLKSAAHVRSAELLAEFENQMGAKYDPKHDPIWKEAYDAARRVVEKQAKIVAARCRELAIPESMSPRIVFYWSENGVSEWRKQELRKMAKTRIDAIQKQACIEIEMASLEAQAEVIHTALTSEAAKSFVEKLPSIASLMPALSFQDFCGQAKPPIVEQLVSPNALRQQRYRDRQKALRDASRNGHVTSPAIEVAQPAIAQSSIEAQLN
jgi:hypothetical protein